MKSLVRIAHLVNPVVVSPQSDLFVAQPITFAALRAARAYAQDEVFVDLLAAHFPEDAPAAPTGFRATPVLDRSIQNFGDFQMKRKLPLLADLLDRLYAASSDADYLIYTNVDIAPLPHFYRFVAYVIEQGYDAFVIHRRTLPAAVYSPDQLPWLYAQIGRPHPGTDCFVFRRELAPKLVLGNVCIGMPPVAKCLSLNLVSRAAKFAEFANLHLTFHIGDERIWNQATYSDCQQYTWREYQAVRQYYAALWDSAKSPFAHLFMPDESRWQGTAWWRQLRRSAGRFKRRLLRRQL